MNKTTTECKPCAGKPGSALKCHDNSRVQAFLSRYLTFGQLSARVPCACDVITGASLLKSPGDTATRPLSRGVLFSLLAWCPTITTASVNEATAGRYARAQVARYAALARVASKGLMSLLDRRPELEAHSTASPEASSSGSADLSSSVQFLTLERASTGAPSLGLRPLTTEAGTQPRTKTNAPEAMGQGCRWSPLSRGAAHG
jgi:hypothetical protein